MCGCISVSIHHKFYIMQCGLVIIYLTHKYNQCSVYAVELLCNDETGLYLDDRLIGKMVLAALVDMLYFKQPNIHWVLDMNTRSDAWPIHNDTNHITTDNNQDTSSWRSKWPYQVDWISHKGPQWSMNSWQYIEQSQNHEQPFIFEE